MACSCDTHLCNLHKKKKKPHCLFPWLAKVNVTWFSVLIISWKSGNQQSGHYNLVNPQPPVPAWTSQSAQESRGQEVPFLPSPRARQASPLPCRCPPARVTLWLLGISCHCAPCGALFFYHIWPGPPICFSLKFGALEKTLKIPRRFHSEVCDTALQCINTHNILQ